MTTRIAGALLLVCGALSAAPASAGWVIDEMMTGADGRQPSPHQVTVQANRMKRLILDADGKPTHAFIIDLDTEAITQVDYQRQQYVTATLQEFVQLSTDAMRMAQGTQSQMAETMARMQESLKNMPPEQRKVIEEMMRSRMPQSGAAMPECRQPKVELRKTGQESTIAGYRATQYELVADGKPESEVWLARELTAWREIDPQKLERFAAEMGKIANCAPGQVRSGFPRTDQAMKMASEGYPVRIADRSGRNVTTEVVKAATRSVPAAEFEPPAGFARKSLREMFGR